ncbi:cytochrome c [Methylibium sp.]|uniref:c-type cytochrome n=1 Tax=Methylibium sp. TaxID=2067992 RepID=UPI00334172A3
MRPSVLTLTFVAGVALLIARALAGGSPPPDPVVGAGPGGAPTIDLSDPARIRAGKSRFDSTCAAFCHGHAPPLFVGRQDLLPEYAFRMISDGGGSATPMPPWGDVFTTEEIWELVAYLKFLGTQKPE